MKLSIDNGLRKYFENLLNVSIIERTQEVSIKKNLEETLNQIISKYIEELLPPELLRVWKINREAFTLSRIRVNYRQFPKIGDLKCSNEFVYNQSSLNISIPLFLWNSDFLELISEDDLIKIKIILEKSIELVETRYSEVKKYYEDGKFLGGIKDFDELEFWFPELIPIVKDQKDILKKKKEKEINSFIDEVKAINEVVEKWIAT